MCFRCDMRLVPRPDGGMEGGEGVHGPAGWPASQDLSPGALFLSMAMVLQLLQTQPLQLFRWPAKL